MPKNNENFKTELEDFLNSLGIHKIILFNVDGKQVIDPSEAEQFKFNYHHNNQDYGTVTITVINGELTIYYNQNLVNGNSGLTLFLKKIKNWALRNGQVSFKVNNIDKLGFDIKKRKVQYKSAAVSESYYGTKSTSYNDVLPNRIKMIIKHNKALDENDKRYSYIDRIFLETSAGERLLLNTKKPSLGRVYARHLAEGGEYNDERWRHISEMISDLSKLSRFIRATKNKTFNEGAFNIIEQVASNYGTIRDTLNKMQTTKGYNKYFESWKPSIIENAKDLDFNSYFKIEHLDPRIEEALPVIKKMNIKINEIMEVSDFENWANNIVENIGAMESKKIDDLVSILSNTETVTVGPDAINIKGQLEDIIDDNYHRASLFKELEASAYTDPNNDSKPIIISWLQKHRNEDFYGDVLNKYENTDTERQDPNVKKSIQEPEKQIKKSKQNNNSKIADQMKKSTGKQVQAQLKALMPEPIKEDQILSTIKKLSGIS